MKKIIRLTESDLHNIIAKSVKKILREDVLGNNWHEVDNNKVLNNYEAFEDEFDGLPFGKDDDFSPIMKDHDWFSVGEEPTDPTEYDPDYYRDDVLGWNEEPGDGQLERGW